MTITEYGQKTWKDTILNKLRSVKDGWQGEGSKAVSENAIANLQKLFAAQDISHRVFVIPNADGAVVLEWTANANGTVHVENLYPKIFNYAVIDPDNTLYLFRDNIETNEGQEYSGIFDLEVLQNFLNSSLLPSTSTSTLA